MKKINAHRSRVSASRRGDSRPRSALRVHSTHASEHSATRAARGGAPAGGRCARPRSKMRHGPSRRSTYRSSRYGGVAVGVQLQ
eukprot:5252281-Prymnesium_polylepis.1